MYGNGLVVWGVLGLFWGGLGCFKGPHNGYANRSNSQMSLPRAIGSPADSRTVLSRTVGKPTIFGSPLVVRQRVKNSLSTA